MRMKKRNAWTGRLLTAPAIAGYAVFFFLPFLLVLRHSVTKGVGANQRFVWLDNLTGLFSNSAFLLAFKNTCRFLLTGLPAIIVLSFFIALFLRKLAEKSSLLKSVLMLPYAMPVVGTVLLIQLLFDREGTGADGSTVTLGALVLMFLWKNTGYAVLLMLSGLCAIPEEHYAAASLDGANFWQKLVYITLPQMRYTVLFTTVFSLINAFKCFREIFLLGGEDPADQLYMLQHFLKNTFQNLNYEKMSAASVLLFLLLCPVIILFYRQITRHEA